jgi:hypothetical protein
VGAVFGGAGAAVGGVAEVPRLARLDQLAAPTAVDEACVDERCPGESLSSVLVAVAALRGGALVGVGGAA